MQQPLDDLWLAAFTNLLLLASIVTWLYLIAVRWRHGRILPYEPRQPVPWGPLGGLLATVFVFVTVASAATGGDKAAPPPLIPDPFETIQSLLALIFAEVVLTGGMLLAIATLSRADERDLGLPAYADQFARDVGIGGLGCLAALVPVFGLQFVVMSALDKPEEIERNPLIEMIFREPHFGVMLLASIAAVIVAPICEEIVFRLLLQGWLEKLEDRMLGWRQSSPLMSLELMEASAVAGIQNDPLELEQPPEFAAGETQLAASPNIPAADPPRRGLAGLPYGWLPILVSSLLFALAHFGSGPDPVPLFVFALILGYLYQRTHRIIPCIVAHALFNLVTMLTLWRLVMHDFE